MDILPSLKEIFYTDNLKFFDVEIDEGSKKSFHVGSNLLFATVKIVDKYEKTREIPLAVKVGKLKLDSRMEGEGCRESKFFNEIVPLFTSLENKLDIKNKFNSIPKCYKTLVKDGYEVLILENLSVDGWDVLNLSEIIDADGQKIVAKHTAHFHALSLALRHSDKETFDSCTKNFNMINRAFIESMTGLFQNTFRKIESLLEESKKLKTLNSFKKYMETVNEQTMVKIVDDKPKEVVVVHGDLQKFNLMCKFKDKSHGSISDAMFIDFQVAGLHSPVLDLTYYFFTSCNLPYKASDFLKYYHEQLTIFLKDLMCDVEEVFPYSTLMEHWTKYAFYGFCFAAAFMKLAFVDHSNQRNSDATIEHLEEAADIGKKIQDIISDTEIDNNEMYKTNLILLTEKFLESINIV